MAVSVKDTGERSTLEVRVRVIWVGIWGDDGLVEDLALGQVGVQVDVGGQYEVLVVISGSLAEGNHIGCRSDLVRVVRCPASPAVFGLDRHRDKANCDK